MSLEKKTELRYDYRITNLFGGSLFSEWLECLLLQISVVQRANVAKGSILHCLDLEVWGSHGY